jgi:hypothetical protein
VEVVLRNVEGLSGEEQMRIAITGDILALNHRRSERGRVARQPNSYCLIADSSLTGITRNQAIGFTIAAGVENNQNRHHENTLIEKMIFMKH